MYTNKNFIIETERLGLRQWIDADTGPCIEMNRDPEVMKFFPAIMNELETGAMIKRIHHRFEKSGFGFYAVEEKSTNQFIGFTGFGIPPFESFFTPCIEIGWRLKKEVWGRGYATEAAKACVQFGFEKLSFDRITSFTSVLNINSEKVMQKIGMKKIGEFDHPFLEKENKLCRHVLYESLKRD
ncbi:MAG: GNAT family N-acetyltransferase [Bacteroidetes bacterium]|nr:GNAT family N-acetyltransferase [Bacteroidota bacterium]